MATPRRVLFPGAIYHVSVKALEGLQLLDDDLTRERCLVEMDKALRGHRLVCDAYCLMTTHFHLLLRTPHEGLPEAMQQLNSNVARAFNRTHNRRGPVLEAPYTAISIERQEHLLETARYVVLNPVRAGMCRSPEEWPWSSYRATAGLATRPRFLTPGWLRAQLGGAAGYRRFVAEGDRAATVPGILLAA